MRHVDIKDKIPELVTEYPAWDTFVRLGNLTKLRDQPDGTFRHANYESGLLLYALVKHYKPRQILEIGTGRGYGAFCMAMALRDCGINGKIITLDMKAYTEKQHWPLDDGSGAVIGQYSLKEVWEKYLDANLRALVEPRQGTSVEGLARLLAENTFHPDFIYVDGDHSFVVSRHDVFASLLLAARPFRMLLDDYLPRSRLYGVRKLVETSLEPVFEMEAIYNDRRWYGEADEHTPLTQAATAQVLLDSEKIKQPIDSVLPRERLQKTVQAHRRWWKLSLFTEKGLLGLQKRLGWVTETV